MSLARSDLDSVFCFFTTTELQTAFTWNVSPFFGRIFSVELVVSQMGKLDMNLKRSKRDKLYSDISKLSDKTWYFVGYRFKNICHALFYLEFNLSDHFVIGYHKEIVLFLYSLKDNAYRASEAITVSE